MTLYHPDTSGISERDEDYVSILSFLTPLQDYRFGSELRNGADFSFISTNSQ